MFSFIKKHFLSQENLYLNIYNLIGSLILMVVIYLLGMTTKVDLWIILFGCSIYLVKALLSLFCIIKFGGQKHKL